MYLQDPYFLFCTSYLSCTDEKLKQLRNIESSLMVLEARLQAERKEIERKFNKQSRAIKEQKRKIGKLIILSRY